MAMKKNKRQQRTPKNNKKKDQKKWNPLRKTNKIILWLAAIGILPVFSSYIFDFFTGDV